MKGFSIFCLLLFFSIFGQSQAPAIQWQNTIGGAGDDWISSIQQTTDGAYILGGSSMSNISGDKTEANQGIPASRDYWLLKLNVSGSILWQNTIGGSNDDDLLAPIQQTIDGGYILGGSSNSNISSDKTEDSQGTFDFWVVKVDASGSIQWQNTIGGSAPDFLHSIKQTSDGGYILGGTSESNISGDKTENCYGGRDYWVIKLDASGNIQWQNTIGGGGHDYLKSVQQTTDGGYILGGYSESSGGWEYWVVKLDPLGVIDWQNTIGGSNHDYLNSLQQTNDGGYILGGTSQSNISGDKTENCIGDTDY